MDLVDTDVLIDIQRGHPPAIAWFAGLTERGPTSRIAIPKSEITARNCHRGAAIRKRSKNRIEHFIEARAQVLSEETKHEIAVFLQSRIFTTVSPVCVGVAQVLSAVELDHQAFFFEEKIDFHGA